MHRSNMLFKVIIGIVERFFAGELEQYMTEYFKRKAALDDKKDIENVLSEPSGAAIDWLRKH